MYILISRCPLHDRTILARQYCRRHCKSTCTCTRDKLITKQHVRKCNYFLNFQNEQYVFNILFSKKKKAPLCWDLQTSNWCFNVKENILQIIIIVQLDLLFILKKKCFTKWRYDSPLLAPRITFSSCPKIVTTENLLGSFSGARLNVCTFSSNSCPSALCCIFV